MQELDDNPGPGSTCPHCGQHAWLRYERVIEGRSSEYHNATVEAWCGICGDREGPYPTLYGSPVVPVEAIDPPMTDADRLVIHALCGDKDAPHETP